MKRILTILFALVMLSSFACAEEAHVVDFTVDNPASYPGEYITLEDFGVQLFVPSNFSEVDVTDLYPGLLVRVFRSNDYKFDVNICTLTVPLASDPETLVGLLKEADANLYCEPCILNGLSGVYYDQVLEENGEVTGKILGFYAMFDPTENLWFSINAQPLTSEEEEGVASDIVLSLKAAD